MKKLTKTATKKTKLTLDSVLPDGVTVKFSCASEKDVDKVTVRIPDYLLCMCVRDVSSPSSLCRGDRFVLDVVHTSSRTPIGVVFTINRDKTAVTNGWPRRFILPTVGNPVFYLVSGMSVSGAI